jgi:iron(II)-dependent oxidoreductase
MTSSCVTAATQPDAATLRGMLLDARARTLALVQDLNDGQMLGPRLDIVNPPLWEIGHLGWFQEYWCLRHQGGARAVPSLLDNADKLYDSAAVAHATRWDLPLPGFETTLSYLQQVLDRVLERIASEVTLGPLGYFSRLAAQHEEMHCEAFTYTRQTLGYAPPARQTEAFFHEAGPWPGDVDLPGGRFMLGAHADDGFVFDNEKWMHEVKVLPFAMARAPVTNAEFSAFVGEDGYRRRELWSEAGWQWRERHAAEAPAYWISQDGAWMQRRYNTLVKLQPHAPVIHVSWHEAQAYCRWAGRRLPTETEWEYAASTTDDPGDGKRRHPWGNTEYESGRANLFGAATEPVDVAAFAAGDSGRGCRQMYGNVWEWTADWFMPYPGFVRDPYKEYSEPWFGSHKVLRGGSFATPPGEARVRFRNFYTPDRFDIFCGFRTCAA